MLLVKGRDMKRALSFCYFIVVSMRLISADSTYETDNGVYVLTNANFDEFMAENPTVLVEFYAPWCGHCKSLAPEYEKAAQNSSIPLAKVDATVETELSQRFGIQGYPTLKFWHNSNGSIEYDGGRDADGILQWIASKTDPNYKTPPEEVITLTNENFDDFIGSTPLALVEFYAPYCGHCKKLAPEYEKTAKMLKESGHNIKLAKVDATEEKKLADQYDVTAYPTMKVFRNGKRFEYSGPRDSYGIFDYMLDQEKPAAKKLNSTIEVENFMLTNDITIVGFFKSEDSKLLVTLREAAELAREMFHQIGYTFDSNAMKHMKAKPNEIVIFYPKLFLSKEFESDRAIFPNSKSSATPEELLSFFRNNCTPLVGHITRSNIASRYSKHPLVIVYYDVDFSFDMEKNTQYFRKKVAKVANMHKDRKYRFAIADEEEFGKELVEVGLGDSGLEHNVILFGVDGKRYPMDPRKFSEDEMEENLQNFMREISKGNIKPYVKSAPLPKADHGHVKVLVAGNFEKVVMDDTKDVLIEFYAPWCGHCKALEPKYRQLAASLKKQQPNLILANFDATANDLPKGYDVNAFPTIYFAPSTKKSSPIKYSGVAEHDALVEFMKANAVVSFQKTEL